MSEIILLSGTDWLCKPYLGLDWLARRAHQPASRDVRGWLPAAVPGSAQHDAWRAGQTPDPYTGLNSLLLEWVPQRAWLYKKTFTVPGAHRGRRVVLHFKGVDYAAHFFLNGEPLGQHRGMFTPALFEVGHLLRYDEENLLVAVVDPAPDEQPQVGRTSQVRTHKARMNYWWDFCPRMVHLGIWDDVQLEICGPVRIEDVWVRPELDRSLARASVSVVTRLSTAHATTVALDVSLLDAAGQIVAGVCSEQEVPAGATTIETVLPVVGPALWWPNGHGDQFLYRAEVRAVELGEGACTVSDARRVAFGIRRVEFAPHDVPDTTGQSYALLVNGRRIYVKGWNWVPLDALYGVPRPDRLERLLHLARRADVNLLRVWGGGLIEKEAFYDLCDRLGILVWQEFIQSSSGVDNVPPVDEGYIDLLAGEAAQIVARKRNHPSLAIWCGGNELAADEGCPAGDDHPLLGALHRVVEAHDPGRLWLPTSPSGPEFNNTLEAIARNPAGLHDVHGPWEHQGLVDHFSLYNRGCSRLHSEFGVEGITNLRTLDRIIPPDQQWPVSLDNPHWHHLGAWWLKEPTLRAAFGELPDVRATVLAAQFLQFDGLRYAVEADRRREPAHAGTLPWQFNEPYPMAACTSAVDYYARPKPAYYAVAAAYAPLHVSARFD
ncbi:MAG TPA: glycoside hydrolase family 2 TIM barrel-domain containing protein, partial [Anaerolineae bacterium]|nr:glycoside hydrolase family 2 TIM barrel-domain containing protein [Anaerolineae bacterium]